MHSRIFMDGLSRAVDAIGKVNVIEVVGPNGSIHAICEKKFPGMLVWRQSGRLSGRISFAYDAVVYPDFTFSNEAEMIREIENIRGIEFLMIEIPAGQADPDRIKALLPGYETIEEWPVWFWAARLIQ